jgi:hypothetical protein
VQELEQEVNGIIPDKVQPCGCQLCSCEGERCNGCGAKLCQDKNCNVRKGILTYSQYPQIADLQKQAETLTTCRDHWKASYEESQKQVAAIRPKADCYDRICQAFNISNNIIGYIAGLQQQLENLKSNTIDIANKINEKLCDVDMTSSKREIIGNFLLNLTQEQRGK